MLQDGGNGNILYFNLIFAQQQENNIQRAFKIFHLLRTGTDDALKMILWSFHSGSLFPEIRIIWGYYTIHCEIMQAFVRI